MKHDERIDNYILGKMSDEDAAEFEAYFLSNQACLDQLELTEKLYAGLKNVAQSPLNNVVSMTSKKSKWWQVKVPLMPIAAAVLLFLISPFGIYQHSSLIEHSPPPYDQQVQVVGLELSGLRGAGEKVIEIPNTKQQLLISIYIDTDVPAYQFQSFAFELINNEGKIVFNQNQLRPNLSSTIYVNFGNQEFGPETYQYRIVGMDNQNLTTTIEMGRLRVL